MNKKEIEKYKIENKIEFKVFKLKFKQLNPKNNSNCCDGKCVTNYISKNDTLICAKCETEKHIDKFIDSDIFQFCTECFLELEKTIKK